MPKRASRSQPALVGNLSPSKRGIVTKDGVHVLTGHEWSYLTWREIDALVALRSEFQAHRAIELAEATDV